MVSRLLTLLRRRGGATWVTAPEMLRTQAEVLLEDYEDHTDFGLSASSSANDAVRKTEGAQSVQWTTDAAATNRITRGSVAWDLSSCSVFAFDVNRQSAFNPSNQRIYLFPSDGGDWIKNTSSSLFIQDGRWYTAVFPRRAFTSEAGASSWNNISSLRTQVYTSAGNSAVVSIDNLRAAYSEPFVLIQFDDQDDSIYDYAFPVMDRLGILGTFYVITDNIGAGGAVTEAMLQEMYAAGWDIGVHNNTNFTTLTQGEIETILSAEEAALDALGLTRASDHVAYPFGQYDDDTLAAMAATSMKTGRGSNSLSSAYVGKTALPVLQEYEIPYQSMDSATLTQAKDLIDDIADSGGGNCMVWHTLEDANWSAADFETLMRYIIAKKVQPITITQLYSLLSSDTQVLRPW